LPDRPPTLPAFAAQKLDAKQEVRVMWQGSDSDLVTESTGSIGAHGAHRHGRCHHQPPSALWVIRVLCDASGSAGSRFDALPQPRIVRLMPRRKVQQLVEEAKQLPYEERAELIEQLIAAAAQDLDPAVEKAWGDEAMRRLKEIEEGKVQMIPGEVVAAKMRKILGRK
jgi:putative addiction module component (TIGR02574 family)